MMAPIGAETSGYVKLKIFLLTLDPKANYQHHHISSIIN